jgi:hypothetical protein
MKYSFIEDLFLGEWNADLVVTVSNFCPDSMKLLCDRAIEILSRDEKVVDFA